MSLLRPKFQLNHGQIQGARTTIPAEQFTSLTTRRYPYPRVGTRAPNNMFPYKAGNPGNPHPTVLEPKYTTDSIGAPRSSGTVVAQKFIPGPLAPKYQKGDGLALVDHRGEAYQIPSSWPQYPGMKPHYILNKAEVQGVMPASTYTRLTGKITTAPALPPMGQWSRGSVSVSSPALQIDWGAVFWGAVLGGVVTLGMVYGVIPAMAEWGAAAVRKRY